MPSMPRPAALLIAAVLVLAPATGEAKRHGHRHHGWMHARVVAVRGWWRRTAHDETPRVTRATAHRRRSRGFDMAAEAALTARRRSEVDAYLRDHPALAVE